MARLWLPTDLPNNRLKAWRLVKDTAAQITDNGPNGYHLTQSDSTKQPTLQAAGWTPGGLPCLKVVAGQFYTSAAEIPYTNTTGLSVMSVITDDGSGNYRTTIANNISFRSPQLRIHGNNCLNLLLSGSGDIALGSRQLKGGPHLAGFQVWQNMPGTADGSRLLLDGYVENYTKTITPSNDQVGMRGVFSNNGSEYYSGLWREDVIWGGLDVADRQNIEGYLAWNNNLQTSSGGVLPTNHPYYSAAPTYSDPVVTPPYRRRTLVIPS